MSDTILGFCYCWHWVRLPGSSTLEFPYRSLTCLLTKSSQTTYHQFRHRFRNWELNYYNIVVEVENNCIYSVQSCKITPNCSFPNQLTGFYLLVFSLPPFYQVIYYKDSLFTSFNLMIVLCVYISGTQKLKIILGIIQPEPSSLWSENIWDNCNLGPIWIWEYSEKCQNDGKHAFWKTSHGIEDPLCSSFIAWAWREILRVVLKSMSVVFYDDSSTTK